MNQLNDRIEREKRVISLLIDDNIPQSIMYLRGRIFDLENLIKPILSEKCNEDKVQTTTALYNSPFEERLDRISYEINDLTNFISDMIDRCQL